MKSNNNQQNYYLENNTACFKSFDLFGMISSCAEDVLQEVAI